MRHADLKSAPRTSGRILAVEDDNTTRAVLTGLLEDMGYDVLEAENGREALNIIERDGENLDVIVLDKTMPEMDGLGVVEQLKNDPKARHIPVVMVTGSDKPEEVREGINAGVFYYLTKPFQEDVFNSVITAAMREIQRRNVLKSDLQKHHKSFYFMDRAEFTISTLEDAENLACFIANCFPAPDTVLHGLAGLLVNAVEHGNLGVGYEEKMTLLKEKKWRETIEARQSMPAFKSKVVQVELVRTVDETRVTITDEGAGFDWSRYMEIDPARALDNNGRGIAQASKVCFDEVIYNEAGNQVTAISRNMPRIKW